MYKRGQSHYKSARTLGRKLDGVVGSTAGLRKPQSKANRALLERFTKGGRKHE